VLRHFQAGSAKRAASVSSIPILNAGQSLAMPQIIRLFPRMLCGSLGCQWGSFSHCTTKWSLSVALVLVGNVTPSRANVSTCNG
jgi:hypothetical protein